MTAKTIINKPWVFMQAIFCSLIILGITLWDGTDKQYNVGFILLGIVLFIGYALFLPNRVHFDEQGITAHYMFGLKTHLGWREVRSVSISFRGQIIPWPECYVIGYFNSKIIFHREACIPKNKKTTFLLEKYYKKPIRYHI